MNKKVIALSRRPFSRRRPSFPRLPRRGKDWAVVVIGLLCWLAVEWYEARGWQHVAQGDAVCIAPVVLDGDTFDCGGVRIRLAGIDTPEMPGHCRAGRTCTEGDPFAARDALAALTRGEVVCRQTDVDVYNRMVARCIASNVDLSCAMLDSGHAVRRYGRITCF